MHGKMQILQGVRFDALASYLLNCWCEVNGGSLYKVLESFRLRLVVPIT